MVHSWRLLTRHSESDMDLCHSYGQFRLSSSSGRIRVDRPVVNARAEVDWEQIQWGEE